MIHPWNQPILDAFARREARLPHAILLHGPRGVGKLALAEHIAQLLLCEAKGDRPCGSCDGCRWYLAGNHPDFRRIEPESLAKAPPMEEEGEGAPARRPKKPSIEIKIAQVRELADFLYVGSHRGRLRVALVHPAEAMNDNSANALLKGLEEPPPGAMFILVSHRPSLLLPTIRSRCVALPVPVPAREAALAWLKSQKVQDPDRWLDFAGGAPLRALDYAASAQEWDQLLRSPGVVDDRDGLERLVEILQKQALDRALAAFGQPPRFRSIPSGSRGGDPKAWLAYARYLGKERLLVDHPLNQKLFSAELLASKPKS